VNEAISGILTDSPHHDPQWAYPKPRWDGDKLLTTTLTGDFGNVPCHPSGLRDLTIREQLRLQGFPDEFEMVGKLTECRKQIGDAVPPKAFSQFLKEVVRTLKEVDEGREQPSRSQFEEPMM
jgi:site-specific DNA-cytosine methylase